MGPGRSFVLKEAELHAVTVRVVTKRSLSAGLEQRGRRHGRRQEHHGDDQAGAQAVREGGLVAGWAASGEDTGLARTGRTPGMVTVVRGRHGPRYGWWG